MAGKVPRLESVDLLRGLVMLVMALDHTRDYFTDAHFDPEDLTRTTVALFLTRWVAHFCAPVFFFLAGVGAGLSRAGGRSARQLAPHLAKRGLFLIALEFTVVRFGWEFNVALRDGPWLGVIWALGVSMIVLAGLTFLPTAVTAAFGLALVVGHNAFDGVTPDQLGAARPAWAALHVYGASEVAGWPFFVSYPLVPWIGVMALGYTFAPVLLKNPPRRRHLLLAVGGAVTAAFVLLRAANGYGDPRHWSDQGSAGMTLVSFLNVTKYPPSLQFLLMTLGPAIAALAVLDHLPDRLARWLVTVGQVPLFFYVVHIYVLHALAVGVAVLQGFPAGPFLEFPDLYPADYGFPLAAVYGIWLGVVVGLYPLCAWFARLKARHRGGWLSYL